MNIYREIRQKKSGEGHRLLVLLACFLILGLGTTAQAGMLGGSSTCTEPSTISVMPNVDRLTPITANIKSPTDIAIDKDGRLYVADLYNNAVNVFSQSGRYITTLSGLAQPISVDVDASGNIYVGNKQRGNVEVYDADFNLLHTLGASHGEFNQPNDIEIDTFGRVFVADTKNDKVKIFNAADGVPMGELGGSGTNDGEFTRPLSIAIDPVTKEILVLDRSPGTWGDLEAKVQFFSVNGIFLRSFKAFGSDTGQMTGPQRIVVDHKSRVFLSDSLLNTILAYDKVGCYVGVVFEPVNHPMTPLGMAIGQNNKLYVTSHVTKSVEVYGIYEAGSYGYRGMIIDPEDLSFEASEQGDDPEPVTISVTNTGNVLLNWTATTEDPWILLSDQSFTNGMIAPGQKSQFEVAVDKTDLEPGTHKGIIKFSGGPGVTEVVEVTLTIHHSSILSVAPNSLSFVSEVGTTPSPQYFTVANAGSATLSWNAVSSQDWVSMSPTAGILSHSSSGLDKVSVLADVTSLTAGTYTATISVSGLKAVNSPAVIEVVLTLVDPPAVSSSDPIPSDRVFDEMNWTLRDELPSVALNSVWTSSDSQVFVVGDEGMILHFDGTDWGVMESPTALNLFGVWGVVDPGNETTDIFAAGQDGIILHYDGTDWNTMTTFGTDLTGVWGTSATDVYAVGLDGTILQYNGAGWNTMGSPTSNDLYAVFGIFDEGTNGIDIFAVGERGTVITSDGASWHTIKTSTKADLHGVWGSSPFDMYAVGQGGTIIKSGAYRWEAVKSITTRDLKGIWGTSGSDIYAVGSAGTIIYFDGKGWSGMDSSTSKDLNSVWGSFDLGVLAAGQDMTVLHYDGSDWQSMVSALEGLNSVWGRSASDVYAVGMLGSILHFDGTGWSAVESPVKNTLHSVWGGYLTDTFAVGVKGTILRYNGLGWSTMASPTSKTLYDVWGAAQNNLYAVGQRGTVLHYDGTRWSTVKSKVKHDLYSIWGNSSSDVYMVGQSGAILRYNGYAMSTMASSTQNDLYSVRVCGSSVLAVGQQGTFLRYDGIGWTTLDSTTTSNLYDVWCSSATDVVVVGQDDTFLYYDGNTIEAVDFSTESSLRGVWGSTETIDIFAVGSGGAIIHGMNE